MKVLLVTSELTYMPKNYQGLFEVLLREVPEVIHGLALLENFDHKVIKSIVGLPLLGANNIFKELCRNILALPRAKREKLFYQYSKAVYRLKTMNHSDAIKIVKSEGIDLIVNLRTREIYKSEILEAPKFGCLNIHHGLLPHYRGTMCDLFALSENRPAGFSIHRMNRKIDAGEIYKVQEVSDGTDRNYCHYLAKTAEIEGMALANLLRDFKKSLDEGRSLPAGIPNISDSKVYTKNPTRKIIKEMKRKGMIL